ncbi:MAG: Putative hydrolase [uncultured Sphingomonadaceae bacterium]|uniref:Hydrolase n=1 Tax=uncultured Sphingomonadaceae bacterium TaxID=169976 RepID=A0A6J4T6B5_9SPHN|nr:MAG: Putative hydrolase [uncultured Sphingomonadaceae bacterium]
MIEHETRGAGGKLLLIHGLGGSARSWDLILPVLAEHREVIAIDLPGHGRTPAEPDSGTFRGLTRSVEAWLDAQDLAGVDVVGSSMGARMALELARRGRAGNVVALDPGGFWRGWERRYFRGTIGASIRLLRALRPALPALAASAATRTALLAQLSAKPWRLPREFVEAELQGYVATPVFDALVRDLAEGPEQRGPAAPGAGRVVIGWGRRDRLTLPRQAARAKVAFPSATMHWFDDCGHFPNWDKPAETVKVILRATG